jgi:FKBP-type peptidyl-prolyl cis-trans isomerase FklB
MKKASVENMSPAFCLWAVLAGVSLGSTLAAAQTPPQPQGQIQAPKAPAGPPGADPAPPPTPEQASYLFGLMFGTQMHNAGMGTDVVIDSVTRGMKEGLQGKQPTPAEQQQIQAYARTSMLAAVGRNQTAAKEFLSRNAREKGVITTDSGLEYKILTVGDKKAPDIKATDKVTVDYRGTLIDGTEFDSSYSRGMPATFPVNGVIKGWQEALVLMKPGAKWQLFIPPELAYGDAPRPKIPGGSLLIFEVNLLSTQPPAPAPAAAAPAPNTAPAPARPNAARPGTPPATGTNPPGTPRSLNPSDP